MQAITTKYYGQTNTRPSCIVAKASAGKTHYTLGEIDAAMDAAHAEKTPAEMHRFVALALTRKLGWNWDAENMVSGSLSDGSDVHVLCVRCVANADGI